MTDITLPGRGRQYKTLLSRWETAKECLLTSGAENDIYSYGIREEDGKIILSIFGAILILRFTHDFHRGKIEYYTQRENSKDKCVLLYTVGFDNHGNLDGPNFDGHINDYSFSHFRVLEKILDNLLQVYSYGEVESKE